MPEHAPIPTTVIGGFLGAGKTTLLRRWLVQTDQRLAVLVNDFGELDIDAALLAAAGNGSTDTIALANGCVCCSTGGDLTEALLRVLQADPPFDGIVVEASGVGDPWRIAQYALAEPRLRLDAVIVLADASTLAAQQADPLLADTLHRQLRHADLVVLNKADLADAAALSGAQAVVAAHAPAAVVLHAVQAEVPLDWLGRDTHTAVGGWPTAAAAHAAVFEAWSDRPAGLYEVAALRAWLRQLPPGLLRLKGLLPTPQGWVELHYAGRHATVRPAAAAPAAGAGVVAISLRGQMPREALAAGLSSAQISAASESSGVSSRSSNP